MINQSQNELFPIVEHDGKVVGSATRSQCHDGSMLLHPVVHLHLFNSKGELYLQHRPAWKDIQPNRWDSSVGGHVDYGEQTLAALLRETREELGVEGFEPRFVCSYTFRSDREFELVNVFTTTFDGAVTPSAELEGGRFWSIEEIFASLGKGIFTPNFENELRDVLIPHGIIKEPKSINYNFRLAQGSDIAEIMQIIGGCQSLLRERGVDQWQNGYPSAEAIELDINLSRGYILERDGKVAAYGALVYGTEQAYLSLHNGEWLSDLEYVTLHRLAVSSDFRGEGIGARFFGEMEREAREHNIGSLRADTHRDNHVMQRLLGRMGFALCGDVYYGESHRLGFERVL